MTNDQQANITDKKRISAIWLIPVIAIVFGGYLGFKAYKDKGFIITLNMPDAIGMVVGKTVVKYKGLVFGKVKQISIADDLNSVDLLLEMKPEARKHINEEALFWVVKPEITLGGVAGLDTLFSGNYIKVRPSSNSNLPLKTQFTVLDQAQSLDNKTPGLHIHFISDKLGSVGIGTQLFHKNVPVGEVNSYNFTPQGRVKINALIKPKYASLVTENSRFWRASGISFEGNLSNMEVRFESLASLIAGGIAFSSLPGETQAPAAKNDTSFTLYENNKAADVTIPATLILPFDTSIQKNSKILFKGLEIGEVKNRILDRDSMEFIATIAINPLAQPILNSETEFFIISPKASIFGVSNLDALITGNYVSFHPGIGEPKYTFRVSPEPLPMNYRYPGLHLDLSAQNASSLHYGDPVLFNGIKVGSIQQVKLVDQQNNFFIKIHIKQEYAQLVNKRSRFWNASGVKLTGSLVDFSVDVESAETLITGGIKFDNNSAAPEKASTESEQAIAVKNGDRFTLYQNKAETVYNQLFTLTFDYKDSIVAGSTKLMLNQREIGQVMKIKEDFKNNKLIATVGIKPQFSWLLNQNTRFWLVDPSFVHNKLSQILKGKYIHVSPGYGNKKVTKHVAASHALGESQHAPGLQLNLMSDDEPAVSVGASVYHKKIPIGLINAVTLTDNGDSKNNAVKIAVTVLEEYKQLISTNSRFYQSSGIDFTLNAHGAKLRAESMNAILAGGISVFNPDQKASSMVQNSAAEGTEFSLFKGYDEARNAGIAIQVHFTSADDLFEGMLIKYQDQEIGKVDRIRFNKQLDGVTLDARLYQVAQHLATSSAKIWKVSPSIGLVGNKNLDAMLGSYLAIEGGEGEPIRELWAIDHQPPVKKLGSGLNLVLLAEQLGSVRVGDPVMFKQAIVGNVIGTELVPEGKLITVYVNIQQKYASLVTAGSMFWNASGIQIEAGLFSGVKVNTGSVESILAGGIAFANPPGQDFINKEYQQQKFTLHQKAKDSWLKW